MSQTSYTPQISILNFGVQEGPQGSGVGSPEGVAYGYPGYVYTNTATGNFYTFNGTAGANTGWVEVTGGDGSGAAFAGSGSPQGVTTASPGNTYIDTATGNFWVKQTGTGTNTGWLELIGN